MYAALKGQVPIMDTLLKAGNHINIDIQKSNSGLTALMMASVMGHTGVVEALAKAGAKTDLQDGDGRTALFWAAMRGHQEVVAALVAAGANVDLTNVHAETVLIAANDEGHYAVVELLQNAGAKAL